MSIEIDEDDMCYVVTYDAKCDCISSAIDHNVLKILACTEGSEYPYETAEFILQAVNKALELNSALSGHQPVVVTALCDKVSVAAILSEWGRS